MFAFILKQRESSTTFRKQTETSKQFSKKKNKQTKKLHQQKRKISHSYHLINQVNKNWTCTSIKECFFGVFVRLFFVLSDQSYLDHTISEVNIGSALIGIIDLVHPFFFVFFFAGRPAGRRSWNFHLFELEFLGNKMLRVRHRVISFSFLI